MTRPAGTTPPPFIIPKIVGLCTGRTDLNWFATDPAGIAAAKAVCAECPSTLACYNTAKTTRETFGIWGGVDFAKLHHPRGYVPTEPALCGTEHGYKAHRNKGQPACPECRTAHVAYNAFMKQERRRKETGA